MAKPSAVDCNRPASDRVGDSSAQYGQSESLSLAIEVSPDQRGHSLGDANLRDVRAPHWDRSTTALSSTTA